jgi:hypothetical protein
MRAFLLALALVTPLALAAPARADIPPPDSEGCNMKSAGDACKADDGSDRTCLVNKCSKTLPNPNGGTTTTEYDCVLCNGPEGSSSSNTDGSADDDSGCAFRNRAAAGAAGAWALGAAVLLLGRRFKGASRRRRRS